jgi:hypothetical protein
MRTDRRTHGFALLMVLMLIVTASVVGIGYIYGAQVKTASTSNLMLASQARYLAESGLQHGLYALQTGATPFGSEAAPNGRYQIEVDDGGYVYYITETATPNDYQIVATGTQGGISQTLSMTVRLTSDYAKKMVEINPKFWWRLGDAELTAVDEQGNDDGAYVNGVIRGVDGAFLGDTNTAAEFRGSNDHINIGQMEKVGPTCVTLGCWVRADAWASPNPRILTRAEGTDWFERRWEMALASTRQLRFTLRLKDSVYELYGQTALKLGKWYFLVVTFSKDMRQMRIYVNGEQDALWDKTGNDFINDNDLIDVWIGDCPPTANMRPWDGPIDEVFIVKDQALTSVQIKELYDLRIPNVEVISWDD